MLFAYKKIKMTRSNFQSNQIHVSITPAIHSSRAIKVFQGFILMYFVI